MPVYSIANLSNWRPFFSPHMAREKRTKPCSNCKRSKVKCEYVESLPCTRCVNSGLSSSCHFVPKLPSLKLPLLDVQRQNKYPGPDILPSNFLSQQGGSVPPQANPVLYYPQAIPVQPEAKLIANHLAPLHQSPLNPSLVNILKAEVASTPNRLVGPQNGRLSYFYPSQKVKNNSIADQNRLEIHDSRQNPHLHQKNSLSVSQADAEWKATMENKLNSFDSKFDHLLQALRENQRALGHEMELKNRYAAENEYFRQQHIELSSRVPTPLIGSKRSYSESTSASPPKKTKYGDDDFRENVISLEEAKALFSYFDTNISQQLFGFEIKQFSVDVIWEISPILICAICTIASMHYPDPVISSKRDALQKHLHDLCAKLLFKGRPRTEEEGFNAIVALVLCSFWLSDSQRFTGLALQLAKEFQFNHPSASKTQSSLSEKDKLKLWYLLYILDGQQSMTLNRQYLLDGNDESFKNSRLVLLSRTLLIKSSPTQAIDQPEVSKSRQTDQKELKNSKSSDESKAPSFTDLRLVSQVEYNQALNEAFKGNAWELIAPSAFGIPSKSNLELDKWMVSWTVLLAPMNCGSVWLSKSTLIYYNFAKMHINSSIVRHLQMDTGSEDVVFPRWENYSQVLEKQKSPAIDHGARQDSDDEDEDDDDEFISNKELVSQDETLLGLNIAVNAAQTVLNLVLDDNDILSELKYVPVHIHIMLYYAALLLVNPPTCVTDGEKNEAYFQKIIENLKTVRILLKKVNMNIPTDKQFGERFINSLDNVFLERSTRLKSELNESNLDLSVRAELLKELSSLQYSDSKLEMVLDTKESSRGSSPKPERISAWPGSHHGHP